MNAAVVWPASTVTLAGTVAAPLSLASAIAVSAMAGLLSVIVADDVPPPEIVAGFRTMEFTAIGLMVNAAVCEVPLNAAEITATVWALTPDVVVVNVAAV